MKKYIALFAFMLSGLVIAQESANRFFYELTFKPKRDSARLEKVMTILDITKDKSVYRDYLVVAQDSLLKAEVENMQKTGIHRDISKLFKMPKFSEKVNKIYPEMKVEFIERVASGFTPMNIGYSEDLKFNWKIEPDKSKIGTYEVQKATTEFGGRKWIAWFTTALPFNDGPYKFHGLPGMIIKIEDDAKNYSWELKGNEKLSDWNELSYGEKISGISTKYTNVSRDKFEKTFNDFKKDPMASARPNLTPEIMSQKMPGSDKTVGDLMKDAEKMYKDFYSYVTNPIEIAPTKK